MRVLATYRLIVDSGNASLPVFLRLITLFLHEVFRADHLRIVIKCVVVALRSARAVRIDRRRCVSSGENPPRKSRFI
jgi:hypothetical protein